jgi:hypothetical protein
MFVAALTIPAAVLLSACGGSSTAASTATSTTIASAAGTTGGSANRTQLTQCLESHGVPASAAANFGFRRRSTGTTVAGQTPPSAPTGTRPTLPAQYQAAFAACRQYFGGGFGGGFGGNSAQAVAYRQCLQVHLQGTGVTLPTTPTTSANGTASGFGGPGGGGSGFASLANNPAYQAATKACAALRPTFNPTATTTPAG